MFFKESMRPNCNFQSGIVLKANCNVVEFSRFMECGARQMEGSWTGPLDFSSRKGVGNTLPYS